MSYIVFLRGERVVLRPLERADGVALRTWNNDPEIAPGLGQLLPTSELDAEDWINSRAKVQIAFGIAAVPEMKLVGTSALFGINWQHRTATTGTIIGDREYRRRGYGTEAKTLVLGYAFETLGLQVLLSRVVARNDDAVRFANRCGYVEVGRIPAWYSCGGDERCDEILFALTRQRWRSR